MLTSPFPFYGSKRYVIDEVWQRLGSPIQYIEPFCGSAAILLGAPKPASLEIINDGSGFIANFWRAAKAQPAEVARWADYPISHVDLGARHIWLMAQREKLAEGLQDPNWPEGMRNVRDGGYGANAHGFIKDGVLGRGNQDGKQV
jgi:D12 class N6 adenine-specific DNA methyltransferase